MARAHETGQEAIIWVCPRCRHALTATEGGGYRCLEDGLHFTLKDGIWHFLLPEREAYFAPFIEQYETVRQDEGWGQASVAYYRALPFADLSGRHAGIWRIRAKSYGKLLTDVVEPLATWHGRPLRLLDLGAGNGWLSYQLARLGHRTTAVDLLTNTSDGLGAHIHYDAVFECLQAEYDRLPVDGGQFDVVIYNGSLHYSTAYRQTLEEALRVMRPDGRLVVMDSPIYHDPASGDTMVRERWDHFARRYHFFERPLPSQDYLTYERLAGLAAELGLQWTFLKPNYGLRWAGRYWLAWLRGHREPATFMVLVGRRSD